MRKVVVILGDRCARFLLVTTLLLMAAGWPVSGSAFARGKDAQAQKTATPPVT